MHLTDEQKYVVREILKNIDRIQVQTLGGYAGTGKTTIIKTLIHKLRNFAVCAYTGKATNVLRRKGNDSHTIHSLIYQPFTRYDSNGNEYVEWARVGKNDMMFDGFIVDEASMVTGDINNDLLMYGKPIIYVGDHGQLQPINSDFCAMENPMYRLETVHRNAGEIAHFANHLREGKPASSVHGKQVQIVSPQSIENRHLAGTDQIICAYNKTRVELNERVRAEKGIQYTYLAVGDKIMCLRNKRHLGLFNGMQGIVEKVHKGDKVTFRSDGQMYEKIHYDPDQFGKEKNEFDYSQQANPFDYAYAITAHKAQGDEWRNVIVYEQICRRWDHNRWAYTSASRAKKGLVWVTAGKNFVPQWL